MAVGAGGEQEVGALLEHLGQPGGQRGRGAGGAELEDLEHQPVDAAVGAEGGGDVGPDRPAQAGHGEGRGHQEALEGVDAAGGELVEAFRDHVLLGLLDQVGQRAAPEGVEAGAEQVGEHRVGVAQPAVGPEQADADGHGVEHVGGQRRQRRWLTAGAPGVEVEARPGPIGPPIPSISFAHECSTWTDGPPRRTGTLSTDGAQARP